MQYTHMDIIVNILTVCTICVKVGWWNSIKHTHINASAFAHQMLIIYKHRQNYQHFFNVVSINGRVRYRRYRMYVICSQVNLNALALGFIVGRAMTGSTAIYVEQTDRGLNSGCIFPFDRYVWTQRGGGSFDSRLYWFCADKFPYTHMCGLYEHTTICMHLWFSF